MVQCREQGRPLTTAFARRPRLPWHARTHAATASSSSTATQSPAYGMLV